MVRFVWLLLGLTASLGWAQGLIFGENCETPRPGLSTYCLKPSAVLESRWNFAGSGLLNRGLELAFGIKLEAETQIDLSQGASLFDRRLRNEVLIARAEPALWYEGLWQFSFLQLYAQIPLAGAKISAGKRTNLSGPWDDTVVGREGRLGLYADLTSTADSSLAIDLAYLFLPDFVGGQLFGGVRSGELRAGLFVETLQQPFATVRFTPRLGYDSDLFEIYWQGDRGFWSEGTLPLGLIDASLKDWSLGGLIWWNPDFAVFDSVGTPSDQRFQAFFLNPQKLFLGFAVDWQTYFRVGVEVSRAPVENIRVYFRVQYP